MKAAWDCLSIIALISNFCLFPRDNIGRRRVCSFCYHNNHAAHCLNICQSYSRPVRLSYRTEPRLFSFAHCRSIKFCPPRGLSAYFPSFLVPLLDSLQIWPIDSPVQSVVENEAYFSPSSFLTKRRDELKLWLAFPENRDTDSSKFIFDWSSISMAEYYYFSLLRNHFFPERSLCLSYSTSSTSYSTGTCEEMWRDV
jgi:hypothetical protein